MYNDSAWDMVNGQRAIEAISMMNFNKIERRDYFAAQVFNALIVNASSEDWNHSNREVIAEDCYKWADAFEKARSKHED